MAISRLTRLRISASIQWVALLGLPIVLLILAISGITRCVASERAKGWVYRSGDCVSFPPLLGKIYARKGDVYEIHWRNGFRDGLSKTFESKENIEKNAKSAPCID